MDLMNPKTLAALFLGKTIFFLSRTFKLGGGFAAPGLYALKIEPALVEKLINQKAKNILITGTNGKTTTSKLVSHFLKASGFKVIRNSSGSNLERGIASYLIRHSNPFGILKYDFGVWEADEFAFNYLAPKIKPDVIILLNVLRDQLDRYGEVDNVIKRWRETLSKLSSDTTLILNLDDSNLIKAAKDFKGEVITFGIKESGIKGESKFKITKKPDFEAIIKKTNLRPHLKGGKLRSGLEHTSLRVYFSGNSMDFNLPLPGIFNVYNFLASLAFANLFNLKAKTIRGFLDNFAPAFGRFEQIRVNSTTVYIFLVKNPVGATQVLQTVLPHISLKDSLLLALNDNFADGKDVSWIWDAEFEAIQKIDKNIGITVSGSRALDLALRLKYAGIGSSRIKIEPELKQAFEKALNCTRNKLFILPTYTAMLQIQKILVKKGIKKEYWKE